MNQLIFQTVPIVNVSTNIFINVPIILRFEDTNLIEIVKEEQLGFTTQIPIYHPDGTYLAKVNGTRMYLTEDGKKANLKIDKLQDVWACTLDNQTLFEIHHQKGDSFKAYAELYTPEGYFVKCTDQPVPVVINANNQTLHIGGIIMQGNTFQGCRIGVWLKKDGSCSIGVS